MTSGTVAGMAAKRVTDITQVRVSATSGEVDVVAEDRADVVVDGGEVTVRDSTLTVQGGSDSIKVRVPKGMALSVGTRSGQVALSGSFGAVGVSSESGQVSIEKARRVDVRTTSGSVEIRRAVEVCRARTESGSISVRETRDLAAHADSGSIQARRAEGDVRVRTTSGQIDVGIGGPSELAAETIDGTIRFELAAGLGAAVEARSHSGRVDNTAPSGDDCRLVAHTVSGHIEVRGR